MATVKEEKLNQLFDELTQLLEDNNKTELFVTSKESTENSKIESKGVKKVKLNNPKKVKKKTKLKEVKEYEAPKEQISEKKGWTTFKLRLASIALAGSMILATYTVYNEIKKDSNSSKEIVSIYDIDEEKRSFVESEATEIKKQILLESGYYFDNISDEEFADGYCRIFQYQKNINPNIFRSAMHGIPENKDQKILEDMIEKAFGDEYTHFSEDKKRDYKQLAFELLFYSQPEEIIYIRNPIIVDGLKVKNSVLEEKGYKIKIKINGDEKETIRNLGHIMHELHEMEYSDFKEIENHQEQFFNDILQKVLEEEYQELSREDKRDYEQLIYEWLPDNVKKYVKDPIEIEKYENEKRNGIEIGE